ncbi:MAG: ADP-ribosylglycohydrolase family protein, partial [Eubacterium sp.]
DVVGSVYEWNNIKTKDFELFKPNCFFTDDTVMTVAVAKALLLTREKQSKTNQKISFKKELIKQMQDFGKRFPNAGYGGMFAGWLVSDNPKPYNSFGNGSAMRVSPCGYIAVTLDEALLLSKASAEVTHNHPEGIKGAQATAAAIFLAKCSKSKEEIKEYIQDNFYPLNKSLGEIRPNYRFNETCQETVPQAIQAFLESVDFEDAIRNAISLGGDSDTLAAITGSIAWAYYRQFGMPLSPDLQKIQDKVYTYLPQEFIDIYEKTDEMRWQRAGVYDRVGGCTPIYP